MTRGRLRIGLFHQGWGHVQDGTEASSVWVGEHERELVTERAQAALLGEQLTTARVRAEGAALNGVRAYPVLYRFQTAPMHPKTRTITMTGPVRSTDSSPAFAWDADPGRLGGWLRCVTYAGSLGAARTACSWADKGSVTVVRLNDAGLSHQPAASAARSLRE